MASQDDMNAAVTDAILVMTGRMQAMQVINDALIATLARSLPPLIGVLRENLDSLSGPGSVDLEPDAMRAYQAMLDIQLQHLDILQGL